MIGWSLIYLLSDPRDRRPRYVGTTLWRPQGIDWSLRKRLDGHLYIRRDGQTGKHRWLNELDELGLRPSIRLVAVAPRHRAVKVERLWISCLEARGEAIVNERHRMEWVTKTTVTFPDYTPAR